MKTVYAVEIGNCGERVYYKTRREALAQGEREKRIVFQCKLTSDAMLQLLNQQGKFILQETKIYPPK